MELEQAALRNRRNGHANAVPFSEAEQRVRALEFGVEGLMERTKTAGLWTEGFKSVGRLLEAAPLATSEFELAKRHLQNALTYCQWNEFGAATFELRIVRGILLRL